eukprot:5131682-Amphidinium_carterae.1
MAVRDLFCQLRAVHALQTYRVMRAAVPYDIPDPATTGCGRCGGPPEPLLPPPLPAAASAAPGAEPRLPSDAPA